MRVLYEAPGYERSSILPNIFFNQERMKTPMAIPTVDMDLCIGCGLCSELCPKVFELRDDKAWVTNPNACDTCDCQQAVDSCPVTAISMA
jgi:ferredoxin